MRRLEYLNVVIVISLFFLNKIILRNLPTHVGIACFFRYVQRRTHLKQNIINII